MGRNRPGKVLVKKGERSKNIGFELVEKKSSISGEQNGFPRFLAYKVVEFEENALQKTHASSKLPRKISRYHCETVSIFNDSFWDMATSSVASPLRKIVRFRVK